MNTRTIHLHLFFVLLGYAVLFLPSLVEVYRSVPLLPWLLNPQVYFGVASLYLIRTFGMFPNQYGWKKPPIRYLAYALGLYLVCAVAAVLIPFASTSSKTLDIHFAKISLYNVVFLLVLAPLTEELFFRGILFQQIRRRYSWWVSMFVSSLIFAGTHANMLVGAFLMGWITCYWTNKSDSILPGIVFHALMNSLALFWMMLPSSVFERWTWLFW